MNTLSMVSSQVLPGGGREGHNQVGGNISGDRTTTRRAVTLTHACAQRDTLARVKGVNGVLRIPDAHKWRSLVRMMKPAARGA